MKKIFLNIAILLLLNPMIVFAQGAEVGLTNSFPDKDGKFSIGLFPVYQYEFQEKWFKKPKKDAKDNLEIEPLDEIERGKRVTFMIMMEGMKLDSEKICDVEYDIKLTGPNDVTHVDAKSVKSLNHKIENEKEIYSSANNLSIVFGPDDPLGDYKVEVTVRDILGGKTVRAESFFELLDKDFLK